MVQTGDVISCAWICVWSPLVVVMAQVTARRNQTSHSLGDFAIYLAWLFQVAQAVAITIAFSNRSEEWAADRSLMPVNGFAEAMQASAVLTIVVRGVSKFSVAVHIRRIFASSPQNSIICNSMLVITGLWTCFVPFIILYRCSADHIYPDGGTTCPKSFARFLFIFAFDVSIEVCLAVVFCYMVNMVQMRTSKKARVIITFNLRLLHIIPVVFYLLYYVRALTQHSAPTYRAAAVWQQVVLGADLPLAILPFLQTWLKGFNTQGMTIDTGNASGHGHQLSNLTPRQNNHLITRVVADIERSNSVNTKSSAGSGMPIIARSSHDIYVETTLTVQ
ncbi:hypothetical protein D6C92_10143 [Aureobasidium pullulans]|nr:hypothetical protein D6C92_10143 [Aureobasidium pullulans]